MVEFLTELWAFMRERKKFWLLPIIVTLVLLGSLIVLTRGRRSPRLYTPTLFAISHKISRLFLGHWHAVDIKLPGPSWASGNKGGLGGANRGRKGRGVSL